MTNAVQPKNSYNSNDFINNQFAPFYAKHGDKFKSSLLYHLLLHMMNTLKGKGKTHCGDDMMNFFMLVDSVSPKAARVVSANLFGPNRRNIIKYARKVDLENDTSLIIRRRSNELRKYVVELVKKFFKQTDKVAFSVSIDGTKVVPLIQENKRYQIIVGGAEPHACISIPLSCSNGKEDQNQEADDNYREFVINTLDDFNKKQGSKEIATEVKLVTLVFQWTPDGISPYHQISARAQTDQLINN